MEPPSQLPSQLPGYQRDIKMIIQLECSEKVAALFRISISLDRAGIATRTPPGVLRIQQVFRALSTQMDILWPTSVLNTPTNGVVTSQGLQNVARFYLSTVTTTDAELLNPSTASG
ncbi:MAG: hypothetical protein MMC33_010450, partial [Icmadophila ericetorum]|nr:hypothetical protein [Icmadophila ericetorum]